MTPVGANTDELDQGALMDPPLPRRPQTIAETGLTLSFIADLVIRALYVIGELTGQEIGDQLCLPVEGVIEPAIAHLRKEQMVEIKGSFGLGGRNYRYQLTSKGVERAREAGERSQYLGPAPVTLKAYTGMINCQSIYGLSVDESTIRKALKHLVIPDMLLRQLGPAINSGRSIFLYGPAGNGKTSISEAITRIWSDSILLPHSIVADGQVIKIFDAACHTPVHVDRESLLASDQRWVLTRRPIVLAGGELNITALDLVFEPHSKYYEAPLQVKANGGVFLIDDFGRQMMSPQALLNRWIGPLEKRVDYLTLHTGKKIEIPFDQMLIFSTNLEPMDLVDEAFLRRIRYKIKIGNPSRDDFKTIMKQVCAERKVLYTDDGLNYLLSCEYPKRGLEMRAVHPRDLVDQIVDIANFNRTSPVLSHDMVEAACRSYFVDMR